MFKKYILRIYDFICSWIYYPKMKKYLNGVGIKQIMNRLQYAFWHSKTGKLSDIGYENLKPTIKDISDGWKCAYHNKPIEKR